MIMEKNLKKLNPHMNSTNHYHRGSERIDIDENINYKELIKICVNISLRNKLG